MIALAYLWYVLQPAKNGNKGKSKAETEKNVQINVSNIPYHPTALECDDIVRKPETDHSERIFKPSQEMSVYEVKHIRHAEQTIYSRCSQRTHSSRCYDLVCSCSTEVMISQIDGANDPHCARETTTSVADGITDHDLNYTCSETCHEAPDSQTRISKGHTCNCSQGQTSTTDTGALLGHAHACSQTNKTSDVDLEAENVATHVDFHSTMSGSSVSLGTESSAAGAEYDEKSQDPQSHDDHDDKRTQRGPVFNPPMYVQRYDLVHKVLQHHDVESVVDFGCAECKSVYHMKSVDTIQRISLVDLDESVLRKGSKIVRPDVFEFLWPRLTPLSISMFHGSAGDLDHRIVGYQAASLIEIIEHLEPSMLKQVTHNVFGRLRPSVVIVTTPNADFNILFPNFTGFRHWDHKFEWSREEFQNWCHDVCRQYGYVVSITGVGDPPPEMRHVGFCTQAAVFVETSGKSGEQTEEEAYNLIHTVVYPIEKRTSAERMADDADCEILTLKQTLLSKEEYTEPLIPVALITNYVLSRQKRQDRWTERDVVEYLQSKYTLTENGLDIIVPLEDDTSFGSIKDEYEDEGEDEELSHDIKDSSGLVADLPP